MPDPHLTEVSWAGSELRLAGRFEPGGAAPGADLLLRERGVGGTLRVPAAVQTRDGDGTFEARVDVSSIAGGVPLPGGLWDVRLSVGEPADRRVVPLGHAPSMDTSARRRFLPGSVTVIAYFGPGGTLAIDVGGRPHSAGTTRADGASWNADRKEVVLTGHLDLAEISMPISGTLVLADSRSGRTFEVIAMLEERPGRLCYTAEVPVTRAFIDDPLPRGAWAASLCLGFSGMHRELRVLAPDTRVDVRVWRRLRPVRVRSSAAPAPLTIRVGRA